MVTKEQCEQALENIANLELQEYEGLYGRIKLVGDIRFNEYRVLRRLIKEHFEGTKALKERFKGNEGEKIKEDPWGDRYADECSKEEIDKWISEGYGLPPIREE